MKKACLENKAEKWQLFFHKENCNNINLANEIKEGGSPLSK
jgi:hypothetical protein